MRIGISTWWSNRGQASFGRYLRSAFDELRHETFVLARPSPREFFRAPIAHQAVAIRRRTKNVSWSRLRKRPTAVLDKTVRSHAEWR